MTTEVVGRDTELQTIERWLESARPSAFLIEGEAGIGKTTLWRAGVERARDDGQLVLACSHPLTRFGGTTATGFGTLRLDYCGPGDNCPTNGKRIRVVASKPSYCKDSGKIEYLRLAGFIGKLEHFGGIISCSPEPVADVEALDEAGRRAALPFERIVEAVEGPADSTKEET